MATTYYLSPITLIVQYLTNVGQVAAGGTIQTYLAGTTTPVTSYTDPTGAFTNPNPLTVASSGRPNNPSGNITEFWFPSGTVIKMVWTDAQGSTFTLDNIAGMNDITNSTTALQTLLASPASSNVSGVGPVAGVDLVANAVKSYDIIADVRAANQPTLAGGQTLNISVQGGAAVNDGYGGDFYWNASSVAADNGATVLKPNSSTGAGRWIRMYTPPFGAAPTTAASNTTDIGQFGTNIINIGGSTNILNFGPSANIASPLYFVVFTGAPLITYNATSMILPGAVNLQVTAGDAAILKYNGSSNWTMIAYFSNSPAPFVQQTQTFVLAADQTFTSNTTLATLTGMVGTLVSGAVYEIQMFLQVAGTGASTNGYKFALTPAGGLTFNGTPALLNIYSGGQVVTNNYYTPGTTQNVVNNTTAGLQDYVNVQGCLSVANPGTLAVQGAELTAANSITFKAGSYLILTRIK